MIDNSMDSAENDVPVGMSRLNPSEIQIEWASGTILRYTAKRLRDACPCATCRERRRGEEERSQKQTAKGGLGLPILSAAEARPLTIDAVRPVGNYAYNIMFSDGHNSGIFTLAMLRATGQA
jgi:DUF971 family protein